jgi:Phage integrase family
LAKIRNNLEKKILEGSSGHLGEATGWAWVPAWIDQRYGNNEPSLIKHQNQWNFLSAFFHEHQVHAPTAVTRDHALKYITWRCALKKEKSKRTVGRNTALADLRWAGTLLREAMEREAINRNPWDRLGFERDEVKERPELLDEHIAIIRAKLRSKPEWMQRSFEIAINTGLRFSETRIRLAHIDRDTKTALIEKPKGGKKRAYSIPIPAALKPMLSASKANRETHTWTVSGEDRAFTGLAWSKFFHELNLGIGYCFHCTRVTFISRGARAGIPEHVMMKLVNHASSEIHRIYRRVSVSDVAQYVDRIEIPLPSQ